MNSISKIIRMGFLIFRAICLCVFLVGVSLQISPIQTLLVKTFVLKENQSIEIKGFSGLFPFYFSFEKINLYENEQQLLTLKNFALDWSIIEFIYNQVIAIQTLKIENLEYNEPSLKENIDPPSIAIPKLPFGYIANINIKKATYKTDKQSFSYSAKGNTLNKATGLQFNLQLKNLNDNSNALTAHIKYGYATPNKASTLKLYVNAKETKGLLHYLIPTLTGKATFLLKGEGELNNFDATLSADCGQTSVSSSLSTSLSSDRKYVDVFTKYSYKNSDSRYALSGTIKTNQTLTDFELHDCKLASADIQAISFSGKIDRKSFSFLTKNLEIMAPVSSEYSIKTTAQFMFNPKQLLLDGTVKSILFKSSQPIAEMDIPFFMNQTLDSLKVSAQCRGNIPDLPAEYQKYSTFKVIANLEPQSAKTIPNIRFELTTDSNKIDGSFLVKDKPELILNGTLFSNNVQLNSMLADGTWHISATANPTQPQSWSMPKLSAKLTPQKNCSFEGGLSLDIESKIIDVEFVGAFNIARQYLDLTTLRAVHKESFIESKGSLDLSKNQGDFSWHFYTFNAGDLFVNSNASGVASILGQLSLDSKDWILTFSGDFHKVLFPNIAANSGNLSGSIYLNNHKNVQFSLAARKAAIRKTVVEDFSVNVNGTLDNFSTTIAMTGFAEQALKGNFAFSVVNLSTVELDALAIHLGQHKILLAKPTRVEYTPEKWTIRPTTINANTGSINFSGDIAPSSVIFNAALTKVSADLLYTLTKGHYFLKGDLDGDIHVSGDMSDPTIKFDFKTSNAPYSTKLSGLLQNNLLKTNIDIQSTQLNLSLTGTFPTKAQLFPFQFELDHVRPFQTRVITTGTLDNLQQIFDLNYDKVFGSVEGDILLYGTLTNQLSKGSIQVKDGGYERQNIGLKLKGINLEFQARGGQFILSRASGFKDQKEGTGEILFAKLGFEKNLIPYLTTEIKFNNIHLIDLPQTRRGGMSAFCTANLKAAGPITALKVVSRGEISSLEKYIGDVDEEPIFQVNLTHQNLPLALPTAQDISESETNTTYDIDLSLERRFHIFGQGLDSTWKGRLVIEGTSDTPIYKGQFTLQEGQLRVLDRFFDVQRGEIFFNGDLSPSLYIESNLNLQDMRVRIILEGDTNNLHKRIVSDSNLSEQEILQKLFFNRSSTVSQSFQALNYLAASSFISSFINIGFYQQEDPITHVEREFISLQQKFSKRTYGKVNVAINNIDSETDRVTIAAGVQPTPQTKAEVTFSPDKTRAGLGLEWNLDF
jgi:autotransporter translocation and assembly factor TamB